MQVVLKLLWRFVNAGDGAVRLKKGDLCVIGAIAAVWLFVFLRIFFPGTAAKFALVYVDGQLAERIPLDERTQRRDIAYANGVVLEVEGARVRFAASGCPDQVCVRTGWLSRPGQSAACVPARVLVTLDGQANEVDIYLK